MLVDGLLMWLMLLRSLLHGLLLRASCWMIDQLHLTVWSNLSVLDRSLMLLLWRRWRHGLSRCGRSAPLWLNGLTRGGRLSWYSCWLWVGARRMKLMMDVSHGFCGSKSLIWIHLRV